jgi:integrase
MNNSYQKFINNYVSEYGKKRLRLWKVCLPNGKGGQLRKQGFISREVAQEWALNQYLQVMKKKEQVGTAYSLLTFEEYCKSWVELKKTALSDSTYIRYRDEMNNRLIPFFGKIRLVEINKTIARSFLERLSREEKINNTTRGMTFSLLKRIVKSAEDEDMIPPTFIERIKSPRPEKPKAKFWDEAETLRFLKVMANDRQFPLWKFTLFTGCRAGELAALKWEEVVLFPEIRNGVGGYVNIKRIRCQKTGKILDRTKNGEHRTIYLVKEAAQVLHEMPNKSGFVFGGSKPIDTKQLARRVKIAATKAGLTPLNFHQLRHTFCSWIDAQGLPRRIVSAMMGHKEIETTNLYSHASDQTILITFEAFAKKREEKELANKIPTTISVGG